MYSCLFAIFILLLNLKYGNFRPVGIECDWSIERLQCPPYGTTDWECLKARLKCSSGKEYHCVRDVTGKWIQICAEAKTCHKGQEPVYSGVSSITCQSCSNPERFEPVESTASYKFSECRRIKKTCPEAISHECPDEAVRYIQNRMCRCANEKNFIPQNYDFDTETWICKDPDDLNCVEDACPEDVNGKKQIRRTDYRCYVPPVLPSTPSPADRSSPGVISEKPTTRLNRMAGPVEGDKGSPGLIIGLILCMLGLLLLILVVILTVYKLKKRNQLDTPVALKASDITYSELMLSWEPPQKGYLPTHYILEKRESKSFIWFRIDTIPAEKTECHVTGLKAGTLYSFSVVAKTKKGKSKRHETESHVLTKCITVPQMPRRLSGYFDEKAKCIQLRWDLPADDGGTPILEFLVEYSPDEDWKLGDSVNKDITEWTKRDLIGGVKYKFRVCARNEEGPSEPAEINEKIQYLSVPSTPADIYVTAKKCNALTLNWKCPESEGGTVVRKYIIRQKQDEYGWQEIHEVQSQKLSVTITHLKSDKDYYFGVSAENRIGRSDFKETELPTVLQRELGPPGIPVGPLKAASIGYTGLTLAWLPPEDDGGFDLTEYIIDKKETYGFWGNVETISSEKTECHIKGLEEGHSYWFRVQAKHARGTSKCLETEGLIETKRATRPEKPVGPIEFTKLTGNSITLSWKPPNDDCGSPVTGYYIYYRNPGCSYWTRGNSKLLKNATTWTQTNLPVEGAYEFRVLATNAKGESQPLGSSELFRPKQHICAPRKPASIDTKDVKESKLTLTWTPPEDDGGSKVVKYHVYVKDDVCDWQKIAVVESKNDNCKVEHLSPDISYYFRVCAQNNKGIGEGIETKTPTVLKKGSKKSKSQAISTLTIGSGIETEKSSLSSDQETTRDTNISSAGNETRTSEERRYLLQQEDISETPCAPARLQIKHINTECATLEWTQPVVDGESKCILFHIKKRDANSNEWVSVTTVNPPQNTIRVRVEPYKEMYYSVAAENAAGIGPAVETNQAVAPPDPPSSPAGPLIAVDVNVDHLTLSWQPPEHNGGSSLTGYILEKQEPKARKSSVWNTLKEISGETTQFLVEALKENTEYYFRVTARNSNGISKPLQTEGSILTKRWAKPPPPVGPIRYSNLTEVSITLSWQPSEDDGSAPISGYNIKYKLRDESKDSWTDAGFVNSSTVWTQSSLLTDHEYLFKVSAVNAKGESKPLIAADAVKPSKTSSTEFYKDVIDSVKMELKQQMDPILMLDGLKRHQIGTEHDYRNIQDDSKGLKKNEKLLEMISSKGQDVYKTFKVILFETGHTDLVDHLKATEDRILAQDQTEKDATMANSGKAAEQPESLSMKIPVASVQKQDFGKTYPDRKSDTGSFVSDRAKAFGPKGTEQSAKPMKSQSIKIPSKNQVKEVGSKHSVTDDLDQVDGGKRDGEDKAGSLTGWEEQEKEACEFLNFIGVEKRSKSWEDLKPFVSQLKDYLKGGCKTPDTPLQEINGTKYKIGKDILPKGLEAYAVSGKDNFLFKSVSCALFGNENFTYRLRLKTVFDGIDNCNVYVNQYFKDKDKESIKKFMRYCLSDESLQKLDNAREKDHEYLAEFTVQMAVRETAIPESMSNPLQVQFLSNTINMPIQQYFHGNKNFFGDPVDKGELAKPVGLIDSVKEYVHILWVHGPKLGNTGVKELYYIVPVAKKDDSKHKR